MFVWDVWSYGCGDGRWRGIGVCERLSVVGVCVRVYVRAVDGGGGGGGGVYLCVRARSQVHEDDLIDNDEATIHNPIGQQTCI